MTEDLINRLNNLDGECAELYRESSDEEVKATINNIRTPIKIMANLLVIENDPDNAIIAADIIREQEKRIKKIREEIGGAATLRSADLTPMK